MDKYQLVSISTKGFSDLSSRTFETRVKGKLFQGFVVRKGGEYFAYQNLCRHLPISLDLGDNQLLTHDKAHLQCHMHGAVYKIDSGLCISGPCEGASLRPLELKEDGTRLVIRIPESSLGNPAGLVVKRDHDG